MYHFDERDFRIFANKLKVNVCDVNLNVIGKFDSCEKVDMEFLLFIREFFRIDIEMEENEKNNQNCLELLGVFFAPKLLNCNKSSVGNIFLSVDRIRESSKKYNLTYKMLYEFVEIHEKAHSLMSPEIMLQKETRYISKSFYIFFEEMLATLYVLLNMKRDREIEKIKNFINNQPFQYKVALQFKENRKEIIEMMITWLLFKADLLPKSKNDLYYEYIDLKFKDRLKKLDRICLLKDIKDIMNNEYIKISDVQKKLGVSYNMATLVLEKLYEYNELDFIDGKFISKSNYLI